MIRTPYSPFVDTRNIMVSPFSALRLIEQQINPTNSLGFILALEEGERQLPDVFSLKA
ncbi:hypothetical protein KDI_07350 [Dictyobacter arantiisoli]|uniref:Uncharacterized protein n=1 Tax=Dictyobacter arantiisoli TaxID=2014874 RepID=A0A5A5T6R3_9CHLR|nr:hypothetical protein KDI_07350 [Dictyobacter arantiisoli]